MPYATPSGFIRRYGLRETVQLLSDEERLLTEALLRAAMDVTAGGNWPEGTSDDEQAVAVAALARIERQLVNTSNLIDGYIRVQVALPLSADDANAGTLEDCCLALVRCELADDDENATERMQKGCEGWRAWLRDIAAKKVQLIGADGNVPASSGGIRTGQACSAYPWALFGAGTGRRHP
ncbi:MAG: DUF1320 family protein [Comamonas sp.]